MLSEIHSYFEGKVHSYHVYCASADRISISISPKSFVCVEPIIDKFMNDMKKKGVEVTVRINREKDHESEPEFDYMQAKLD